MDEVTKRVVELIDTMSGSKKEFAELTGISNVKLSHLSSGRNAVSLQIVIDILSAFPQISPEWLLLGIGQKIKQPKFTEEFKRIQNLTTQLSEKVSTFSKDQKEILQKLESIIPKD
jgi:plasmid maintenance system antidote protein VapI